MKAVVIYKTKYGSTKQYAEWVAQELKADVVDIKNVKNIDEYDTIIFGSCVYVGTIRIAKYIKSNWNKLKDKKVVLFSVSGRPIDDESIKKLYNDSVPEEMQSSIKYFPLPGRIIINKLKFFDKLIVKIARGTDVDQVKKENIKELVKFVKG